MAGLTTFIHLPKNIYVLGIWQWTTQPLPSWNLDWESLGLILNSHLAWHFLHLYDIILRNTKSSVWVQFSHSVVTDSLRPPELQHARPPCPSPTPGVHSNPRPSIWWCHPAISSSVVPFSSCPQSLPASGSFPVSHLFTWGGQSIGVSASASVLPMNT